MGRLTFGFHAGAGNDGRRAPGLQGSEGSDGSDGRRARLARSLAPESAAATSNAVHVRLPAAAVHDDAASSSVAYGHEGGESRF